MSSQYTRNQAICIAFYVDYTDENVEIYKKKIEELDSFEICWTEVDSEPVLVSLFRIRSNPLKYKKYKDIIPEKKDPVQEKRQLIELVTEGQVKQFVNEVFSPKEHENEELYSKQTVSTADVYEIVKQHTVFFGSRTAQSFATWCRNKKVDFLNSREKKGKKISRDLFILDERYYEDLVNSIITYLPRYQDTLKLLTLDGVELVGYARKSPIDNDPENTTRLMQAMVRNLKERSFASRIYVSSSWASTRLVQRDLKPDNSIMEKLEGVNGNTQDFLEYVKASDHSICLISIDFYGITTISSELVQLIESNPAIKKIAIETFAIDNEVYIFDAETLKNDQKMLKKIDNRSQFYNRSK